MTTVDDKFYHAKVVKRTEYAPDLWMFRVDPGGDFKFISGQYATLGVEHNGKRVERPYSIVSAPHESELEFFVELVPHGDLTPLLYARQMGDNLFLRKSAKGRFVLEVNGSHKHHLLVATVTGVAPYVSFVRSLRKQWQEGSFKGEHKLYIIYGASRSWEFGYEKELLDAAKELPWLKVVPTISRPWEDADWKGETGRVDDLLRKYTDLWVLTGDNATAYLCGHPEMIEHGKGILKRRGFGKESVREEVYWIPAKEPVG